jgi:hypothetical protein
MAGTDSRMGVDPFVGRIEGFGDILVGHDLLRKVAPCAQYFYTHSFFLSKRGDMDNIISN